MTDNGLIGLSQRREPFLPDVQASKLFNASESTLRNHTINGDGVGLGWFPEKDPYPSLFRTVEPAWNCYNLRELSKGLTSKMFFCHVRATDGDGAPVAQRWVRNALHSLPASVYHRIHGGTDSELAFGIFYDSLMKQSFRLCGFS